MPIAQEHKSRVAAILLTKTEEELVELLLADDPVAAVKSLVAQEHIRTTDRIARFDVNAAADKNALEDDAAKLDTILKES